MLLLRRDSHRVVSNTRQFLATPCFFPLAPLAPPPPPKPASSPLIHLVVPDLHLLLHVVLVPLDDADAGVVLLAQLPHPCCSRAEEGGGRKERAAVGQNVVRRRGDSVTAEPGKKLSHHLFLRKWPSWPKFPTLTEYFLQ